MIFLVCVVSCRFTDNTLKQKAYHKLDAYHFLSHAWVGEDRVFAGTNTGKLLLLDNGLLKHEFDLFADRASAPPANVGVNCIVPYSRGFVCAAGDIVQIFDKTDENQFRKQVCATNVSSTSTHIVLA